MHSCPVCLPVPGVVKDWGHRIPRVPGLVSYGPGVPCSGHWPHAILVVRLNHYRLKDHKRFLNGSGDLFYKNSEHSDFRFRCFISEFLRLRSEI